MQWVLDPLLSVLVLRFVYETAVVNGVFTNYLWVLKHISLCSRSDKIFQVSFYSFAYFVLYNSDLLLSPVVV